MPKRNDPLFMDRSDQTEIWELLRWLTPQQRIAIVKLAASWCNKRGDVAEVRVTGHTGSIGESFNDLLILAFQNHLDLPKIIGEIARLARRAR